MSNVDTLRADVAAGIVEAAQATSDGELEATIIRSTAAASDTPWAPADTAITQYTAKCILSVYSERERDGALILQGDRKVLMAADEITIEPGVSDRLLLAGVEYAVVSVMAVAPGGVPLFWKLQVRQ